MNLFSQMKLFKCFWNNDPAKNDPDPIDQYLAKISEEIYQQTRQEILQDPRIIMNYEIISENTTPITANMLQVGTLARITSPGVYLGEIVLQTKRDGILVSLSSCCVWKDHERSHLMVVPLKKDETITLKVKSL